MAQAQPGVKGLAVAFRDTYKRHAIQDIAAGVTYWTVLSIVPAALAVTAMLGWFEVLIGKQAADDVRAEIIEFVERTLGAAGGEISTTIIDILTEPSSGVAIVGFLLAVWSMSKGFASLFRGLARIHGDPEARNNLVGRLLGLGLRGRDRARRAGAAALARRRTAPRLREAAAERRRARGRRVVGRPLARADGGHRGVDRPAAVAGPGHRAAVEAGPPGRRARRPSGGR